MDSQNNNKQKTGCLTYNLELDCHTFFNSDCTTYNWNVVTSGISGFTTTPNCGLDSDIALTGPVWLGDQTNIPFGGFALKQASFRWPRNYTPLTQQTIQTGTEDGIDDSPSSGLSVINVLGPVTTTQQPWREPLLEAYTLKAKCALTQVDFSTQAVCVCDHHCDPSQCQQTLNPSSKLLTGIYLINNLGLSLLLLLSSCIFPFIIFSNSIIPPVVRSRSTPASPPVRVRPNHKPGPKSGRSHLKIWQVALLLAIARLPMMIPLPGSWGECCPTGSCGGTEANFTANDLASLYQAKFHDQAPPVGFGRSLCQNTLHPRNSVQKRSLKRAYAKACRFGSAWYRGQCLQKADFPAGLQAMAPTNIPAQTLRSSPRSFPSHAPRYRMQVGHINVGGLSFDRLKEIKQWAGMNEIDILVLSETRWSFSSEWEDANWAHIHSGSSTDRADGLLFLIRKKICPVTNIGFAEDIPGRLGHLRIHFQKRALDILGCYQYVDTRTHDCKTRREFFWDRLDNLLHKLPKRNSFLLCGDLNCSLQADGHHVGQNLFTWRNQRHSGPRHKDMPRLQALIQSHDLLAMNTWSAKHPPTFVHGDHASRIDYFFMRATESDGVARDIKYFPDAAFLPLNGAFHIPMSCSIRKIPYHKEPHSMISSCSYHQRLQCRAAWTEQTDRWTQFQKSLNVHWNEFISAPVNATTVIDDMHQALQPCFHNHFPKCQPRQPPKSDALTTHIDTKWYHRTQMRQIQRYTLRDLFRMWFHSCRFTVLKRQQQRLAREYKRQQIQDLMTEVAFAASRNDTFTVYQAVKRFSPKQPMKKIRIRTLDGTIADPATVLKLTREHILEVWAGPQYIDFPCDQPPGIPFTQQDLAQELSQIPVVKSVARPFLPGLCWKTRAPETAAFVYNLLQQWWNQIPFFIPMQWKQAWLTFISKPNKPPDRLAHLRPLALQEPIGKCVLGLLNQCLANQLRPYIQEWPQFAFSAHRSPLDAIRRVVLHCKRTRQLIGLHRRTVHQIFTAGISHVVCGGIQLYVDVHQAFDRIPRQPLFDFLRTLDIDTGLLALIAEWHSSTEYLIWHEQAAHPVQTGRGVRQGCRIAPTLWLSYTLALFREVSNRVSSEWVRACLTMFADDLHAGETFTTAAQLHTAIQNFGHLLDAMEHMGLMIALDKTFVLIHICGTNSRSIRKQVIQTDQIGQFIEVPRANGTKTKLRIRHHAKYLGVTLNYTNSEWLTFQTRQKAAQITFQRLKKWLCQRKLSLRSRLQMWQSCVFMSLVYGLFAVDVTLPILQKTQSLIFGMYRKILRNFSQQTGHTHAMILETYGLQHPLTLLQRAVESLQSTLSQRLSQLNASDIVLTIDWTSLHESHQMISAAIAMQTQAPLSVLLAHEASDRLYHCSRCALQFHSIANLRRHETHAHGLTQLRSRFAIVASFATNGLPQCSHCSETFSTWRHFQIHLERNCCQAIPGNSALLQQLTDLDMMAQPDAMPLQARHLTLLLTKPYGSQLLDIVVRGTWQELLTIPDALQDLAKYCILCGTFHSRPQDLNQHMKTQHIQWYNNVHVKALQLCKSQASISPCRFCNKTFQRAHQCPILTQLALLLVNLDMTGGQHGSLHPEVLRCAVCRERHPDLPTLHRHLAQVHQLEMTDWQPLQGTDPVCAHCQTCFADVSAVRQHITMGQCSAFDPVRPLQSVPVQAEWRQIIESGDVRSLLKAPMQRLHLTTKCQLCRMSYQRASDLALHLQTVHALQWQQSQRIHPLLLTACQALDGCYCNPQTNARGLAHTCPALRQLSMLAIQLHQDLFVPWQYDQQGLACLLTTNQCAAINLQLQQCLIRREFATLWTDPTLMNMMATTCIFCGGEFPPAALRDHVYTHHAPQGDLTLDVLPQLVPCFHRAAVNDHTCHACHQIFNVPGMEACSADETLNRRQLAHLHLAHQCPVLFQTALLLTYGAQRPADAAGPRGLRNVRSLWSDEQPVGNVPEKPRRRKCTQTPSERGPATKAPRRRPGHSPDASHGISAAEVGRGAATDEKARLMDLLYANRRSSSLAVDDGTGSDLEEAAIGQADSRDSHAEFRATTLPSASPLDQDAAGSNAPTDELSGGLSNDADRQEARSLVSRRNISISALERTASKTADHNTATDFPQSHGEVPGATPGASAGSIGSGEVPIAETSRDGGSGTLAPADFAETGRSATTDDYPARQYHMEHDWHAGEASLSASQQTSTSATGSHGQGSRQELNEGDSTEVLNVETFPTPSQLRRAFEQIRLANHDNWCFINSAFLATTWAQLSSGGFTSALWGPHASALAEFLQTPTDDALPLSQLVAFRLLLTHWADQIRQGDAVEFLAFMLRGLEFSGFDMRWEVRLQIGSLTQVQDKNENACTPILLQFDPTHLDERQIPLQTMIMDWSNQHGRQAALLGSSPLVCVHVDRHVLAGNGSLTKSDVAINVHGGCELPHFVDASLNVIWREYHAVAMIAHFGQDNSGHCRSLLFTDQMPSATHNTLALLTEDWERTERINVIPYWFKRNITCIWLCRTEQLALYQPQVREPIVASPERPNDAMTALLRAMATGKHDVECWIQLPSWVVIPACSDECRLHSLTR